MSQEYPILFHSSCSCIPTHHSTSSLICRTSKQVLVEAICCGWHCPIFQIKHSRCLLWNFHLFKLHFTLFQLAHSTYSLVLLNVGFLALLDQFIVVVFTGWCISPVLDIFLFQCHALQTDNNQLLLYLHLCPVLRNRKGDKFIQAELRGTKIIHPHPMNKLINLLFQVFLTS